MKNIYLDYNASAPIEKEVLDQVLCQAGGQLGNPSSELHPAGKKSRIAIETAREQVADFLGCRSSSEVIFTSGATESTYLALFGAALGAGSGALALTSNVEHSATRETMKLLEKVLSCEITSISLQSPTPTPTPTPTTFGLSPSIVSIMLANNETGIIHDVVSLRKAFDTSFFHTDAVQILGKEPFSFVSTGLEAASISGHKIGALQGVGVLLLKSGVPWISPIVGGGQEQGRRGGTENVIGILSLAAACCALKKRIDRGLFQKLADLRNYFEECISEMIPNVVVIGSKDCRISNTSQLILPNVLGKEVVKRLGKKGVYISTGSACTSGSLEASHVLMAMGFSTAEALSTVRISIGHSNTKEELWQVAAMLSDEVKAIRKEMVTNLTKDA